MKDKVKQIFLVTFVLFSVLMWQNLSGPTFYSSQENDEYQEYMGKKISRILDKNQGMSLKDKQKLLKNALPMRSLAAKRGDCLGCCRDFGGVRCIHGKTYCKNGNKLSEFCTQKGCNACPVLEGKK
jgi:hypothetical protein